MEDEFCCGYGSDEYCPTCGRERPDYVDPSIKPHMSLQNAWDRPTLTAISRSRYKNDPEYRDRLKKNASNWAKRNPTKAALKLKRREARKRGATISDLTHTEWQAILVEGGFRCYYCQIEVADTPQGFLTQDHLTPLSRGGNHTKTNIKQACLSCNTRKGARTEEEFLLSLNST